MISREDRERGERLRSFCEAVTDKPVVWGVDDCSTWPLQWVLNETRQEIDWPTYDSREGAKAVVDEAGGLVALWDGMARRLLLSECVDDVLPIGAVAVVETRLYGPVGCIMNFANIGCFRMDFDPASRRPNENGWKMWGVRSHLILKAWTF